MKAGQKRPLGCNVAGFLEQLPLCGLKKILARITFTRGHLDKNLPDRVAILPLDQYPAIVK